MYIMAPEHMSGAYFINIPHQSASVYPPIVARQRLHETIEELLDASIFMWHMSFEKRVGDQFFPARIVFVSKPLPVWYPFNSEFLSRLYAKACILYYGRGCDETATSQTIQAVCSMTDQISPGHLLATRILITMRLLLVLILLTNNRSIPRLGKIRGRDVVPLATDYGT